VTSSPRICIAHQTVMAGDAIGNDIAGAYELLARCGYEMAILCEHVHPDVERRYRVIHEADLVAASAGFDMMLYHHSIHWPGGEVLLQRFAGPVVVKYHNITPPRFFERFAEVYRSSCELGREQTARIASFTNVVRWQSDSAYNAAEIVAAGVPRERSGVVPPFNSAGSALGRERTARYYPTGPFEALFVGRQVPNKGHAHLLRTVAAWRELFPEARMRCRIVGARDPRLDGYYRELADLQSSLDLDGCVEWLGQVGNDEVADLFRGSHLYLNLSEHEGFCVPLIEAQAIGLPMISSDATAIPETAGSGQLVVPLPRSQVDYDLIAGLTHQVCTSADLRRRLVEAGCRNVFQRFVAPVIESRFMEELEPVLRMITK
jgi:glycosyltransferase involved in cell wall biosynthesis